MRTMWYDGIVTFAPLYGICIWKSLTFSAAQQWLVCGTIDGVGVEDVERNYVIRNATLHWMHIRTQAQNVWFSIGNNRLASWKLEADIVARIQEFHGNFIRFHMLPSVDNSGEKEGKCIACTMIAICVHSNCIEYTFDYTMRHVNNIVYREHLTSARSTHYIVAIKMVKSIAFVFDVGFECV